MFIGIDMGGTKIAGGLVDNGKILKRVTLPTGAGKGRAHVIKQLKAVIDELAENQKIQGVGIGVPGVYKGTKIITLNNIPALNGVDLKAALKLKAHIVLENDARCFLLGEHRFGAAFGKENVVGLIIGTGLGSAAILNGRIYHGSRGQSGEFSDVEFPAGERWEDIISGPAILKRHKVRGGKENRVSLIWQSNSAQAKRTRKETIDYIASLVRNVTLIYDPEVIVLGGGVSSLPLVDPVNALLKKHGERPILVQNQLGVEGAILGAVTAFHHK